ncbi:hypothetical protein COCVIDRAFT_98962 [Bipolaris victoriae FI3]|uniref:Uncharacterized protein n=1 Tax=Bipolaris victoriae (strain FI3) TaxID=930091 RepID=W7E9N2_BIPV3|nr:hypothetical protein COCVIDRAFT_98962 [Bipolaris victoriae FI3]
MQGPYAHARTHPPTPHTHIHAHSHTHIHTYTCTPSAHVTRQGNLIVGNTWHCTRYRTHTLPLPALPTRAKSKPA